MLYNIGIEEVVYVTRPKNITVMGKEYSPEEIMQLPITAMYATSNTGSSYRIDFDRQVAFSVGIDGRLVYDNDGYPQYTIIQAPKDTSLGIAAADMLASVSDYQKNAVKNQTVAPKVKKESRISLGYFLLGIVLSIFIVVGAAAALFLKVMGLGW